MHKTRTVKYRRKREGKTNYRRRLDLLKSRRIRAVVRKSNKSITVQFVEFSPLGDKVVLSSSSKDLVKEGWKHSTSNVPAAYLVGFMAGVKAKQNNIKEAIADIGFNSPTSGAKVFAAVKGITDSGLSIPFDPKKAPSDERLKGQHIVDFSKQNKGNNFSKTDSPQNISQSVEEIKKKIEGQKNE